jgi:hypothetical protein
MFVSSFLPCDVGKIIDFEMQIDRLRFSGSGRVVWKRTTSTGVDDPTGMAVEFLGLTNAQKRLLHREISYHIRGGGDLRVGTPPGARSRGRSAAARPVRRASSSTGSVWRRLSSIFGG